MAVITLSKAHVRTAGSVLARAFTNDPLTEYVFGGRDDSLRRLGWLHETSVRYALRSGRAYTTPDVEGVAAWLRPGATELTILGMLRAGMFAAPLRIGPAACVRLSRYDRRREALHARSMPDSHWYLLLLGVDPNLQGRGLGRALMQPVLDEADATGTPCYLDTTNPKVVAFYERHGFESVGVEAMAIGPDGGRLQMWGMVRRPGG